MGKPGKKPNPVAAFFGLGLGRPASSTKKTGKPSSRGHSRSSHTRSGREAAGEEVSTPVAAHAFSGHFITFAIVLVIIALSVYTPLTSFIRQQNEISEAQANIAALQAQQSELKAQVSWWEDDNYVKQQARSRLFYVQPGQTPYLVVGLDSASGLADDTSAAARTAPEESWTAKLWDSVQLAAGEAQPSESPEPSPSAVSP